MLEVHVCPKCRKIYIYRKKGGCPRCGQLIARHGEYWGEDEIWFDKDENGRAMIMTYQEGLKRAKKRSS